MWHKLDKRPYIVYENIYSLQIHIWVVYICIYVCVCLSDIWEILFYLFNFLPSSIKTIWNSSNRNWKVHSVPQLPLSLSLSFSLSPSLSSLAFATLQLGNTRRIAKVMQSKTQLNDLIQFKSVFMRSIKQNIHILYVLYLYVCVCT